MKRMKKLQSAAVQVNVLVQKNVVISLVIFDLKKNMFDALRLLRIFCLKGFVPKQFVLKALLPPSSSEENKKTFFIKMFIGNLHVQWLLY